MSAATSTAPAAYEAWGVEGREAVLLGVGATKGDCDRIHRHHEGGGITVRGGVVIAVKTGTVTSAKASLQHAAFAAYRERGDLPAPTETDRDRERIERIEAERERQRAALRLVAPLSEERADEGDDEESDEADEEPARAADDCDEPEDNEDDEDLDEAPETTPDDQDEETETRNDEAPVDRDLKPANVTETAEAPAAPERPHCAARGCSRAADAIRTTTRPEVADLCGEHRMLARRMQHNRGVELAAAVAELRERGYVPIAPQPTAARTAPRAVAPAGCPVPGCGEPSAPAQARTAPELVDLCTLHRTRVRDLLGKVPGYTPALARERIITGQRPAGMAPALTHAESGARGGKARTKILRPAVAETVRRVPAAPVVPAPAPVLAVPAPAGSPLGERVAVVRRLVACETRAGGVEAVERLVDLADRYGADEIVALVNAAYGGAA